MLANIDKIKATAKERGISVAFLCRQLGLQRTFLNDVKLGKCVMNEERLEKIAEILDINVDYLADKTEEKLSYKNEKSPPGGELSSEECEIVRLYKNLSPQQKDSLKILLDNLGEKKE